MAQKPPQFACDGFSSFPRQRIYVVFYSSVDALTLNFMPNASAMVM